jgi:hypothetical protein
MTIAHDDKVEKLLKEGKISPEQYQELQANLPEKPVTAFVEKKKPWQVWVCSIFLFAAAVLIIPAYGKHPYLIIATILNTILGFGLFLRKRWAFIATAVFGVLAVLSILIKVNLPAFLLNLTFCIILGSIWKYYFPKK